METFEIIAYRDTLQDKFSIGSQVIHTDAELTLQHIQKIEYIINEHCYQLEKFCIKAVLEIDKCLFYTGSFLKRVVQVSLIQLLDFDGNKLLSKALSI